MGSIQEESSISFGNSCLRILMLDHFENLDSACTLRGAALPKTVKITGTRQGTLLLLLLLTVSYAKAGVTSYTAGLRIHSN